MKNKLILGDYVLATKYKDGDPYDHWCIGFFDSILEKVTGDRYIIVDERGNNFRGNGFRRAEKISFERGKFILDNKINIENNNKSLWWWKRTKIDKS